MRPATQLSRTFPSLRKVDTEEPGQDERDTRFIEAIRREVHTAKMARSGRLPSGRIAPVREGHCYGEALWASDWRPLAPEPLDTSLKLMRGKAHRPMARLGTFQPDFPRELVMPVYHTFGVANERPRTVLEPRLGLLSAAQY